MSGLNESGAAYSASWWESRTAEQLQEFVRAGFMSGEAFDGAQRELERRARESTRRLDEAAQAETRHRADQGNWVAFSAAAFTFLLAICALIWVAMAR